VSFIYPYSVESNERRKQVWDNLQKGLLFEDTRTFIPWTTQYKDLDKFKETKDERGDRTYWYLGQQKILHGLTCHVVVLKWKYQPDNSSFDKMEVNLGADEDGHKRFLDCIDHLTRLLGSPTKSELEKFGIYDLGVVTWTNGEIEISVVGIEIFNCRYSLNIGLIDNSQQKDLKQF
jgi:hypothetical protein